MGTNVKLYLDICCVVAICATRNLANIVLKEEFERGELWRHTDRLCFDDGAGLFKGRFRQGRERGNRLPQVFRPRLNVGTKRDDGSISCPFGVRR